MPRPSRIRRALQRTGARVLSILCVALLLLWIVLAAGVASLAVTEFRLDMPANRESLIVIDPHKFAYVTLREGTINFGVVVSPKPLGADDVEFSFGYMSVFDFDQLDRAAKRGRVSNRLVLGNQFGMSREEIASSEEAQFRFYSMPQRPRTLQYAISMKWWVFCGIGLVLMASTASVTFPSFRRRMRLWHGQCPHCGYDLTGNTSGICSECGEKVEPFERAEAKK